jgi:hypothetical protein
MRCRKCNTPDFEKVAVIVSREGWYKGTIPAHLEILVCQECGYTEQFIEANGEYFGMEEIWTAHWHEGDGAKTNPLKPEAYMGGYGPRIINFDTERDTDPTKDRFEYKPRTGWTATFVNVDEAAKMYKDNEAKEALRKLREEVDRINARMTRAIFISEEPGEKANRKLDEIIKKIEDKADKNESES